MSPGTSRPAKTSSYPKVSRGFVPPHLASRLSRFAFTDDPQYAERTPPEFSLACEQIFRLMPDDFWVTKRSEMNKLKEERNVIRSRLREGKGVRSELLKVSEDMRQRLGELAMGYVVLDYARYNFAIYLHERGVVSEYWWQALEEFAEGAAGGLSLYWPASARRECTEGAMITANFPRLTSLSSTPSSRSCFKAAHTHRYHSASSPPQQQSDSTALVPDSPCARHSAVSDYSHLVELVDSVNLVDVNS
ncbi:hypothetical protein NBRC10512_007490 [Rhodotorula toruloides]|uniref:Uncharacterized protein n=1 Tax=Rhodotorula toruloides (strain NP11) TaxID=1130832 RepID=M7XJD8_RHOT1|nr:uncharacterized protein RHTO_06023 [Rhodotorula toruloides NP11]EMS24019.1 hypothetical protein RHTO_06023 [Rhodotorula toruloides NP11]